MKWYDEKLWTVWRIKITVFSPDVNFVWLFYFDSFFMWRWLTTFDFSFKNLSKRYIITLNKISPSESFRSIDNLTISLLIFLFSRWCSCISVFIIIRASFCWSLIFPDFIASFTFAKVGIRCSFKKSLINLMSLLILHYFPFPYSRSNVLTFCNICRKCFLSICLNMLTWANSLMAKSITRSSTFFWLYC